MIINSGLPTINVFDIPLGAMLFDIIFIAIVAWFIYRGVKKGFTSIFWLGGNVVGMIALMAIFKATMSTTIDSTIASSIDFDSIPIPLDIVNGVINTTLGIIMATVGLLFLNGLLLIIFQFVKKPLRAINDATPSLDSKIIGGVAGAALGVFMAMSVITPVYAPIWGDYYDNLDNSISIRMTGGLQSSIYGTKKTVSAETLNSLITSVNLITDATDSGDSLGAILDILEKAGSDPILGAALEGIVDGAIDGDLIPSLDVATGIDVDTAYTDITEGIFGKESTLTEAEKIAKLNEIFDLTIDPNDHSNTPSFGEDTAKKLACKLLTNEEAVPVVKPAACA